MAGKSAMSPANEPKPVLKAFSRALGREAHVLVEHPDLLWQQMYNRLQWEGDTTAETLADELERRSKAPNQSWLRLLTRFRESESILRVIQGHSGQVNSIGFSHSGKFLLSAGDDQSLKIWEVSTGQPVRTINGHSGEVTSCAFSLDDRLILSTSKDKTMKLWETATGRQLDSFEDYASDCVFSPDGRSFLSIGIDNRGRIRESGSAQVKRELYTPDKTMSHCVFSPDGRFIVTVKEELCVWESVTGQFIRSLGKPDMWQEDCAISPDAHSIAVAQTSGLDIWDTLTEKNTFLFYCHGHEIIVSTCAFSPDGRYLITGGYDKTLRVWEATSGREIGILEGHANCVECCSISPDGRYLASGDWNGTIILWDLGIGFSPQRQKGQTDAIFNCAYSSDGSLLASASMDRSIIIRFSYSEQILALLDKHFELVTACAFSPDGHYLASTSDDKSLRVWDLETGQQINVQGTYDEKVNSCAFSPDGRFIVTACEDKLLYLWEVANNPCEGIYGLERHTGSVLTCMFSPDGQYILSASEDKTVCMWDFDTHELVRTFTGHEDVVSDCAFSPDGLLIASASYFDKTVRVLEPGTGKLRQIFSVPASGVAFSPDGRFLLACGGSKLSAWNLETTELTNLYHLPVGAFAFCLHPCLPRLAVGMGSGAVYQYTLYGITYGPIIVTAVEGSKGITVRCPHCRNSIPIPQNKLGREIICPNVTCKANLQVNQFILHPPEPLKIYPYIYEPIRE